MRALAAVLSLALPLSAAAAENVVRLDEPERPGEAAPAPALEDPFTLRGLVAEDAGLRSGPDELAPVRARVSAGTSVAVAPARVGGYHRVRLASGASGWVAAAALDLGDAALPEELRPAGTQLRALLRLGVAMPTSTPLSGFDPGLAFEAGLAWRLSRHLQAEFALGRFALVADDVAEDALGLPIRDRTRLAVVPFLTSMRAVWPTGPFELSVSAGTGVVWASATSELSAPGYVPATLVSDDTGAAWTAGAGASVKLGRGVRLELEGRKLWSRATLHGSDGRLDSLGVSSGLSFRF